MARLAKYVAIALVASMFAAFAAAAIYLISAEVVGSTTETIPFAAVVALSLMPAATVVAVAIGIAFKLLERARPALTIPLIVTLAAFGGAAVGVWASGGPHVSRELAIKACATSFGLVAVGVLVFVRSRTKI
jgi:hypothetical protein